LAGQDEWKTYQAGDKFAIGGNTSFDIETVETLDYVCHYE
jgi:hypothetical protein